MNLITMIAVLLISLLFTIVFVVGLKSRGPWGSGWTFFTIVCLWLAAVSLWIPPAGPVWFGVPWIDLFVTALLVSFVLSATSIDSSPTQYTHEEPEQKENPERVHKLAHPNKKNRLNTASENTASKNQRAKDVSSPANHGSSQSFSTQSLLTATRITRMHSSLAHEPFEGYAQVLRAGGFFWMLLLCLCALIIMGAS